MWDPTMSAETTGVATLREAMCRAFRSPLVPAQQQQILAALEEDSKSVFQCGLTPQRLPELVENNPVIAAEALLKLMVCRGCQARKYLKLVCGLLSLLSRLSRVCAGLQCQSCG